MNKPCVPEVCEIAEGTGYTPLGAQGDGPAIASDSRRSVSTEETDMLKMWKLFVLAAMAAGLATPALAQDAKVAAGAKVFAAQKCSICHSVAGVGNKKAPLDGVGKTLTEDVIRLWITDPKAAETKTGKTAKPPMKSYKSLAAADLDALVAYLMSLK
jgi:mono/diheme cytochrome c family protein